MKKSIVSQIKRKLRSGIVMVSLCCMPFTTFAALIEQGIEPSDTRIISVASSNKATIITAPLDSRPISIEYLQNLVSLGGDEFISPNKGNLDFFSGQANGLDHFGDSARVREEIKNNVSLSNQEKTSVIINTASYFTGGLVGTRCYRNYDQLESNMAEFNNLTMTYTNPYYYVNVTMPRTLPEDRNNTIWPNDNKLKGLGYYYCKYNKQYESTIGKQFSLVTPAQFLLEWSYVQSKAEERGASILTPWESEFLTTFNEYYLNNMNYSTYIENYRGIFKRAADLAKSMISAKASGQIDELVVSIDDMQLPTVIQNMSKLSGFDSNWLQKENGNVIKFSFARSYLQTGTDSVWQFHKNVLGESSFIQGKYGKAQDVNYIFGADEVPQLIYARDLVRRQGLSTQFENFNFDYSIYKDKTLNDVGVYDAGATKDTLDLVKHFITRDYNVMLKQTARPFKIYVNKYIQNTPNISEYGMESLIKDLFNSYNNNTNVGVIEIYSFDVIASGENTLFKKLSNRSYLQSIGIGQNTIGQLGAYSSWNTGGNAIGLGMAHAQVFGIAEEISNDEHDLAVKQSKMLAQHLLEDGIYSVAIKSRFNANNFGLNSMMSDQTDNMVLKAELTNTGLLQNFLGVNLRVKDCQITLNSADIQRASFPWLRRFECYVDVAFS